MIKVKVTGQGYLFFGLENLALGRLLLRGFDAVEKCVVQVRWQVDLADIDFGARGNHVNLVDASQGAAVDLEWTADEQQARLELLQEDDTLQRKVH